ncbi:MAG: helix-turn-helix domain-containing protein [Planctomycetota bacterium]|nr:helix-turn-helix domain-containing protein [Planctomycetota bacterium]
MAILELRACRGLSTRLIAQRFHLTRNTISSWMGRLDEEGPNAFLQLQEPVNKFPDLVRYIVQRLRVLCPALGKVKLAEFLCRAGLHLGPTTVKRMLGAKPTFPADQEPVLVGPVLKAKGPDHV